MNIIFGDAVNGVPNHYILLELDTFQVSGQTKTTTAYCLIEELPLEEYVDLLHNKTLHADAIKAYKQQHWDRCEQALQALTGKWGGQVDSFYTELTNRIVDHRQHGVPEGWTAVVIK